MEQEKIKLRFYETAEDFRNNTVTVVFMSTKEAEEEAKRQAENLKQLFDSLKPTPPKSQSIKEGHDPVPKD